MKLFLSHAWVDKDPLQELRRALEARGLACWEDVREQRAGDRLLDLEKRVREAAGFVVLLGLDALGSKWVQREVAWARAARAANPAYRIVALVQPAAKELADLLLGEGEPIVVPIDHDLLDAVPRLVEAFTAAPPAGRPPRLPDPPPPRSELVIRLRDPSWAQVDGRPHVCAELEIEHVPAGGGARGRQRLGRFESPLGSTELGELAWYLEVFPRWAFAENLVKGREVEAKLAPWGRALYDATLGAAGAMTGRFLAATGEKRVVVEVDAAQGEDEARKDEARKGAAAAVLALPWELLRGEDWLFAGKGAIRVVRRLPRSTSMPPLPLAPRLRVLLVVARTDDAGFIDARASLTPLVEALRPLGHKVEVDVLPDGTLPALHAALAAADEAGRPYQVVHFDGHGVYDPQRGLGLLVFEHPDDAGGLTRRSDLVDADKLGAVLQEHRLPLFVLEACQSAHAGQQVESSVAGRLLRAGIGSVVAMSHSVLVETARRFVGPFYAALAQGERIGAAMLRGQQALHTDARRNRPGHPDWTLRDWFVPILFQDEVADVPLLPPGPLPDPEHVDATWNARLADTPALPAHGFVGRARELLSLHRALHRERAVALLGVGGQGKTALAIEAARWLLAIGRFERLAWVSVEHYGEARVVVDALGRQLVAGWTGVGAVEGPNGDLEPAIRLVERALRDWRVLVVVDNLESVLADPDPALLPLLGRLAKAGGSRLLVTSREAPPAVVGAKGLRIGPLSTDEGRELVSGVLRAAGRQAPATDADDWIGRLVETVGGHPRSLVLLAPRVAEQGLRGVVEELGPLLAALEREHPGDRENSLLASVQLSLAKLPEPMRTQARALCVFRGAAHVSALAYVAEVEPQEALDLCRALVELGLAEAEGTFLTFEPSLPATLGLEVGEEERAELEGRWVEANVELARYLYQQLSTDARSAAAGARLALSDLLASLEILESGVARGAVSVVVAHGMVRRVESLAATMGRPVVLDLVAAARRRLGERLDEWSHTRFEHERADVSRRLGSGDLSGALAGARALLERVVAAGDAYEDADYDRALACASLGRVLHICGRAHESVPVLEEARRRFDELERRRPGCGAARMASVCITDRADALSAAGHLDQAAAGYEEAIALDEADGRAADVAVGRGQLGTVRMLQGRYDEALALLRAARKLNEELGQPTEVAALWHQEGMVYRQARNAAAAERGYLASLELSTRHGNIRAQAATLGELGNLYASLGRRREAADFHRRAGEACGTLGDQRMRSFALGNLAATLRALGELGEARAALTEAIGLMAPYGPAAEPWKAQALLAAIETDSGSAAAATAARAEAVRQYRAFRDAGGSPHDDTGRLVEELFRAVAAGAVPAVLADGIPPAQEWPAALHPFRAALGALLLGQPADLDDPRIAYDDTAELLRLRDLLASR